MRFLGLILFLWAPSALSAFDYTDASNPTFSIADDTDNGAMYADKLLDEINESTAVTIALTRIDSADDVATLVFAADVPSGERAALETLVSEHDGVKPTQEIEVKVKETAPFAAKVFDGKALHTRVHGKAFSVVQGANNLIFTVPYAQVKFNGVEVLNAELGDHVSLKVLDTTTGTYTTYPNFTLDQFGFSVYVREGFYQKKSDYDSELLLNMQIKAEYESITAKTIYINYLLHEMKDL